MEGGDVGVVGILGCVVAVDSVVEGGRWCGGCGGEGGEGVGEGCRVGEVEVGFAGEVPTAGAEGDDHVGNEAGEGGALFYAAEERGSDGAVLGGDVDGKVSDTFGEEFDIAFAWEAFDEEGKEL